MATTKNTTRRKKSAPRMGARMIGYARVSTPDQSLDLQIDALKRYGIHPDDIYTDHGSAVTGKLQGLHQALALIVPGDTFVVWRLDRLARSLDDLKERVRWFQSQNIRLVFIQNQIDTSTAIGMLLLHVLGAVAEFERELTRERTRAGMAARKARGVALGAPRKFTDEHKAEAAHMLARGEPVAVVAEKFNVVRNTILRYFPPGVIESLKRRAKRQR